jgi:hypothetical protein
MFAMRTFHSLIVYFNIILPFSPRNQSVSSPEIFRSKSDMHFPFHEVYFPVANLNFEHNNIK